MKAIVQDRYGSTNVLRMEEIRPAPPARSQVVFQAGSPPTLARIVSGQAHERPRLTS